MSLIRRKTASSLLFMTARVLNRAGPRSLRRSRPIGRWTDGPACPLKEYSAARVSSFARDGGNRDTIVLPLGGEEVTLADIQGPGAITHIWTTFTGDGRDIILRFYWEGSVILALGPYR